MSEEWKPIPDWPNYLISNAGQVFSIKNNKVLKLRTNRHGYMIVSFYLWVNKQTHLKVHQIVNRVFNGEPPTQKHITAHLNGIKTDNRAINLAWATPKENSSHMLLHGTRLQGERHPSVKLTTEQVKEIRKRYLRTAWNKSNSRELAREFGITKTMVTGIASGKYWKCESEPANPTIKNSKRNGPVNMRCKNCEKEFTVKFSYYKAGRQFCSKSCTTSFKNKKEAQEVFCVS